MLIEQQIAERRDRAQQTTIQVLERPAAGPYGDYRIKSSSGRTYRVAVRGPGLFENYPKFVTAGVKNRLSSSESV